MGIPYAEVIGDPIAHSKSPLIHKFWLDKLGLPYDFRRTRVPADQLSDFLLRRRGDPDWRGCSVTIPHKEAVAPLLDERRLQGVEAVNCVVPKNGWLVGYNTDVTGVAKAVSDGVETWAPVCIIGAGGAARAVIAELEILAVQQFNLIVRDPLKGRRLVAPYGEYGQAFDFDAVAEAVRGCVGLVNASPLGMDGFAPMPETLLESLRLLNPGAFVFDLVYAPVETQLLRRAAALGLTTIDGLAMLVGQAEAAFSLFFGEPPPAGHEAELRERLSQ